MKLPLAKQGTVTDENRFEKGLDVQQREIITFAAIATLGGAEPQLKGHILRKGSRKTFSSLLYANSMIPEKPTFYFRRRSAFCIASLEFHRISCYTTPSGKT